MSPSSIRIVVVLPDPFGPRNPNTEPTGTSRFNRFDHCHRTEPLREVVRSDRVGGRHVDRPAGRASDGIRRVGHRAAATAASSAAGSMAPTATRPSSSSSRFTSLVVSKRAWEAPTDTIGAFASNDFSAVGTDPAGTRTTLVQSDPTTTGGVSDAAASGAELAVSGTELLDLDFRHVFRPPPGPPVKNSVMLFASTTVEPGGGTNANVEAAGAANEMSVNPNSIAIAPVLRAAIRTSSGMPVAASTLIVTSCTVELDVMWREDELIHRSPGDIRRGADGDVGARRHLIEKFLRELGRRLVRRIRKRRRRTAVERLGVGSARDRVVHGSLRGAVIAPQVGSVTDPVRLGERRGGREPHVVGVVDRKPWPNACRPRGW